MQQELKQNEITLGTEWRWEHELVHIGAWLHGYLNGGSTKTKTNGEWIGDKMKVNYRNSNGDYNKN